MIIAVDFYGTLTKEDKYPKISELNFELIETLKNDKDNKVILWTCRSGHYLEEAIRICHACGLYFDAINDNIKEHIDKYNNNCRKVYADIYLDDKNTLTNDFLKVNK